MSAIEIPKEYRTVHTAETPGFGGAAKRNGYYFWPDFGGKVHFIAVPSGVYKNVKPVIELYANGALYDTKTPSSTALSGKPFYKVMFTGLTYGDEYRFTVSYGDDTFGTGETTYLGGRGSAPEAYEESVQLNAEKTSPYDKAYSSSLAAITFSSDYGALNSYSREARTRLVESCLQSTEYDAIFGKVGNLTSFNLDQYDKATDTWTHPSAFTREAQIYRFDVTAESPAKVGIVSGKSKAYFNVFSDYVDEWISDVNFLLGGAYFVRDDGISRTEEGIRIQIGSHEDLFGYDPDGTEGTVRIKYGTWERTHWEPSTGATVHCEVKLCNELRFAVESAADFRNVVYEELTECLGCGNDTYRVYDSIFSEVWYIGKSNKLLSGRTPTYDGEVVQMLYRKLGLGETMSELVHKLTPSQACIVALPSVKWGNIRNKSYSLRTYAMNRKVTWRTKDGDDSGTVYWWWDDDANCYSDIEDSITVTPPYSTPKTAPVIAERGSVYLKVDVGDTKRYDVKAEGSTGDEHMTLYTAGRYIYVNGLSPTETYRIYSRVTGSEAWFGDFPGTTNPAIPSLSADPAEGGFTVTVGAPVEGGFTEFYMHVVYTKNGTQVTDEREHVSAGSTFTYEADADTKFSAYANTIYTVNGTELWSESAVSEGFTNAKGASNPTASRIDGGFKISWEPVPDLVLYRVKVVRLYDSYTTVSDALGTPEYTVTGLQYGVTHKISVDTYNGGKWVGYCAERYATTAPARPVIESVSQNGGVISAVWALAAESNVSKVYFGLYSPEGVLIEEKIIANETSGEVSFSASEAGEYEIRVKSSFIIGGNEIFSVDDNGGVYILCRSVGAVGRPEKFYWSSYTSYMKAGCAVSGTPYRAWNALISNVEAMLSYTGVSGTVPASVGLYGSASGLSYTEACAYARITSDDRTLYAYKFNIANRIISAMCGEDGTGIAEKYGKDTEYGVYASDLMALQNSVNSIN